MKTIILLVFIFFLLASFGKKEKGLIPPGTVNVNDTLFADETEVSNFSWREYEFWMGKVYGKESLEYKSVLPDTLVWRDKTAMNEPYVNYYYRHVAYRDYPVVGVSYEQVVNYCKWRTDRVHEFLEIKAGKRKKEDRLWGPYTGKLRLEYRLPTKQEWEGLALPGIDETKIKESQKGQRKYNAAFMSTVDSSLYNTTDVTTPVYSCWPNKLGMYNIQGNVSELVAEKGIAKGGSWKTEDTDLIIWKDEPFERPNAWTGFRCVCVIKK